MKRPSPVSFIHHLPARGFTLVELIIVIAVIAILVTVGTISFTSYLADGRDSQRTSKATVLAEALEKYYDLNGEYPSCAVLSGDVTQITQSVLTGLDQSTFIAPQANSGVSNSISCTNITGVVSDPDVFAYMTDDSTECVSGNSCLEWVLRYRNEGDKSVSELKSRRSKANPPAPTGYVLNVAMSGANAIGSVASTTCQPPSTPQYQFRSRTTSTATDGAWSNYGSWSSNNTDTQLVDQGFRITFQAQVRCKETNGYSSTVATGNVSTFRPIATPSAPVVAITNQTNPDSVTWSWSSICPTGTTAYYQRAWYRDDSTAWRAYSADTTLTDYAVATNYQGYEYKVKAKGYCKTTYSTSASSPESNQPGYIRAIQAPAQVAVNSFGSSKTNYTNSNGKISQNVSLYWTSPTCGTGTSTRLELKRHMTTRVTSNNNLLTTSTTAIFTDAVIDPTVARWRTADPSPYLAPRWASASLVTIDDVTYWVNWIVTSADPVVYQTGNQDVDNYVYDLRAYVRYACLNTTTNRFTVSAGSTISPLYTWSQ